MAEKSGLIKVFDSLTATTPTVFADLRTNVHNFWDRGLLGLALHPDFPNTPYVYVLYTLDAKIGGTPPLWGTPGATADGCPNPPGANVNGCVVSGRLSRLQAAGDVMTGTEQVLIEEWCAQFPSHTIGSLAFGPDGALYVSAGEGASFVHPDYGQYGSPVNPCGDPPAGAGGAETPPSTEGGALRALSLLRNAGEPAVLDGAILRVDPLTGAALPDNPLFGGTRTNADRIIAYGLRNPFRMTMRPGTKEIWIGDVGQSTWEEIDRIADPTDAVVENFGWPCYEGVPPEADYQALGLSICSQLYNTPAVTPPYFAYQHQQEVASGDGCGTGSSAVSGLAFYAGGKYGSAYDGALFFADYSRRCIWSMFKGLNGDPDPSTRAPFDAGAANPVDLEIGPEGDLFYVDLDGGTVRRIIALPATATPTATPTMTPTPTVTNTPAGAISGHILYYASGAPVSGASVQLLGPTPQVLQTDAAGLYASAVLTPGTWTVQPQKSGDVHNAISALDAVYVLQVAVGLRTLSQQQTLACDVNGDGTITPTDAVKILQYQVGLLTRFPVAVLCGSDWVFVPMPSGTPTPQLTQPQISTTTCQPGQMALAPLSGPETGADFQAVLFGDCTGNW